MYSVRWFVKAKPSNSRKSDQPFSKVTWSPEIIKKRFGLRKVSAQKCKMSCLDCAWSDWLPIDWLPTRRAKVWKKWGRIPSQVQMIVWMAKWTMRSEIWSKVRTRLPASKNSSPPTKSLTLNRSRRHRRCYRPWKRPKRTKPGKKRWSRVLTWHDKICSIVWTISKTTWKHWLQSWWPLSRRGRRISRLTSRWYMQMWRSSAPS